MNQLSYSIVSSFFALASLRKRLAHQNQLTEWLDYATRRVPQMQQEMIEQGRRGLGLEVIFVEGDEKIIDANKRSLQRPRVFYRRETETAPLVIAKP